MLSPSHGFAERSSENMAQLLVSIPYGSTTMKRYTWIVCLPAHLWCSHRFLSVKTSLVAIYVFYTIPITWAATFGSVAADSNIPGLTLDTNQLYGLIRAQLLSLLLA
jgi:hypothetical protein